MILRLASSSDFQAVLALNEESLHFLSPLSPERLTALYREAEVRVVIEEAGAVLAFLLAFREGADYDSINYQWFGQRYERFLYVDRVVVSQARHGTGAGRLLYDHVFAHARATQVPVVTCEYDVDPPNPVSARFHARFGFSEVGRQVVAGGKKSVSLQAATVKA
jgi:uncharacterized protein